MSLAGYELRKLDWDTDFFGIKMGEVLLADCGEFVFSELVWQRTLEIARGLDYQFLFCQFDACHQEVAAAISGFGATIGDILVTFSLPCDKTLKRRKLKYQVSEAIESDLPGIFEIAHKSFNNSRFLQDHHFNRIKAEQFYPSWVNESFMTAGKILVIKDQQQVLGFISLKPEHTEGKMIVSLIAVKDSLRGKGVGQTLIDQAVNLAIDQKFSMLQVGTQLANYSAINLYEKNGFRIVNAKYRYHIWLNTVLNNMYQVKLGENLH